MRKDAAKVLQRAVELGVNFIDTADSYGPGTAETLIYETLYPYDGITIATKGGFEHPTLEEWIPNGKPEHLRAAVDGSLKRLHLEQVALYYLHAPDENVPYAESIGCLEELRNKGKIRFVGISNVTMAHVEAARAILGDSLVSVQNYYNVMFHHGADKYYPDTESILDECERREWAFVAWEPMGTGEEFPKGWDWTRKNAEDLIESVAAKHKVSTQVARLAAVLSRSNQIIAIPGTGSLEHLEANMKAMEVAKEEGFQSAWVYARAAIMSLRKERELQELQRRLSTPVNLYSAADLPDWKPSSAPKLGD